MSEEYETEIPPPSPDDVAARALILSAVAYRGHYDDHPDADAAKIAADSLNWLRALSLDEHFSEWERQLFETPYGALSERDRIDATWLSESIVVLAWALQKSPLPPFNESCEPADIVNSLGFLQPAAETALRNPELRSLEELLDYNEFIYNVHWRTRDFSLHRRPYDFEALARKAWDEPLLKYGLALKEKDLAVGRLPISKAAEKDWRELASIMQERHRASNWLIGYESTDFYLVTTDT